MGPVWTRRTAEGNSQTRTFWRFGSRLGLASAGKCWKLQVMGEDTALSEALARRWYHTIELAPGQTTAGIVDLRPAAEKFLTTGIRGVRALDVGTFDGFWAFELERRGADEVVAADLDAHEDGDWPPINRERLLRKVTEQEASPGERFRLAARALGSRVERVGCSVYDLDASGLGGHFDVVTVGCLLLHLRDPVAALERIRATLRPGGTLLLIEPFLVSLTLLAPRWPLASLRAARTDFDWWAPNLATLRHWLLLAGFGKAEREGVLRMKAVNPHLRQWLVGLRVGRDP